MDSGRKIIWFLMFIGGAVGGFIPMLWGASALSLAGVILTALGGLAGIWLGVKISG